MAKSTKRSTAAKRGNLKKKSIKGGTAAKRAIGRIARGKTPAKKGSRGPDTLARKAKSALHKLARKVERATT